MQNRSLAIETEMGTSVCPVPQGMERLEDRRSSGWDIVSAAESISNDDILSMDRH